VLLTRIDGFIALTLFAGGQVLPPFVLYMLGWIDEDGKLVADSSMRTAVSTLIMQGLGQGLLVAFVVWRAATRPGGWQAFGLRPPRMWQPIGVGVLALLVLLPIVFMLNEVMVARHVRKARTPDFTEPAENEFQRNLEQGVYQNRADFRPEEEKERLARKYEAMWRIVPPMGIREFEFTQVLCDRSPDNYVQLRYKTNVARYPPDENFRGLFVFGDRRKNTKLYEIPVRHVVDRYHTVRCPADAVAPDDTLLVRFINENPFQSEVQFNNIIEFPRRDQPEVLFVVGTFAGNLVRLLTMMQCKLMFLGAIALLATTILSFPVASLFSFTVYVLAGARGFINEAIEFSTDNTLTFLGALQRFGSGLLDRSIDTTAAQEIFLNVVAFAFAGMKYVIPDFGYFDGVETFVDGRNVSLAWVLQAVGELALLKTGIALGLAMLFFHRREVAEVSL